MSTNFSRPYSTTYGVCRPSTLSTTTLILAIVLLAGCPESIRRDLPPRTPELHRAAARDDVAKLRRLAGKDVDRRGPYGWTPLHYAAIYGARKATLELIKRRANVDALDQVSMTPLHWAARKGNDGVIELLLAARAEVNSRNLYDMTPLHEASTPKVVEILLARGAKLEARNIDGMTPLHTASTKSVAQFLIKKGANLNAKAKDGRTPMDMPPVPIPRTGS